MLTKKSFIAIMAAIKEQQDKDDENGNIMSRIADPKSECHEIIFTTPMVQQLIDILVDEFNREEHDVIGDDISYWIYEADYGNKFDKMWRKDRSEVPLKTAGDLYDWLVEQIET